MTDSLTLEARIERVLEAAFEEVNARQPAEERVAFTRETPLYGKGGHLDSLALVNFVLAAETQIEREFGRYVPLADEKALSRKRSPYRTVEAFIAYVRSALGEAERGR